MRNWTAYLAGFITVHMQVEVRLFATLRRYFPEIKETGWIMAEVAEGATIADLMDKLGVPAGETKVIMRNFRQADIEDRLSDGDRVAFIPAVGGG
jgi:molybdopterin converting factor small subunit